MIDAIDARILTILQENARTSNAEIARQVDLAPSAVFERIRKLEERGVIEGYSARVNATAVGLPLLSFIFVRDEERPGDERTSQLVSEIPEVLEVHHVAGEDCLLVKVRTTDTDALGKLLRDRLGRIPTIVTTRTTIVLGTVKESSQLPLPIRRVRTGRGGTGPCLSRGPARRSPRRSAIVAAFAAVYVLWGSTYLGIRFSMETLPPFFTQGVRFFLAGVLLYAWARWRGEKPPTRREWGGATITGALLFVCGSGGLVWAEHFIPSGVAALVVATEPMSFVLLEAMRRRRRPHGVVLAGLALGTAGLLVLVGPGTFFGGERFHLGACLVLVAGTFAWAWGSLFSRGSRLPSSPLMATAATLLTGGGLLALVGVIAGELGRFDPSAVSTKSIVATIYLFIFGSIVGFSAYLWLLRNATASRVSTYAYVNPIVAVFLGWALAGEPLSPRVLVAAVIIIGAVALIIRHGGEEENATAEDFGCAKAPETLHA